jgi:ABC-2 type transport system permease protein
MQKILRVAQREYLETVKTKTFIFGLLMVPFIIGGIIFFVGRMARGKGERLPSIRVAMTDLSKELSEKIKTCFDEHDKSHPERQFLLQELPAGENPSAAEKEGKNKLRRGHVDAYVVVDSNVVEGDGQIHIYTYKPKPVKAEAIWSIDGPFRRAVVQRRYEIEQLDQDLVRKLGHVPIKTLELGAGADEEHVQSEGQRVVGMMVPFFFMYLIFMGIVGTGQQMLSSIIEEKSSRIIEVLLSAVSPFELMAGKIVGLAAIGLTVTGLWAIVAYGVARSQGLNVDVTRQLMLYFVVYYILGFLMFSSILAGVGSVCNTLKETQSLMMPIMMVFIIPLIGWFKLVQSPDGMLARVLSFVPPLTPMVMILRLSATSDTAMIEILASIALLAVAVLGVMWAAAKVFRTGILMYGKRPGFVEVLRWLKQS